MAWLDQGPSVCCAQAAPHASHGHFVRSSGSHTISSMGTLRSTHLQASQIKNSFPVSLQLDPLDFSKRHCKPTQLMP
jgi:hypothetical protein